MFVGKHGVLLDEKRLGGGTRRLRPGGLGKGEAAFIQDMERA